MSREIFMAEIKCLRNVAKQKANEAAFMEQAGPGCQFCDHMPDQKRRWCEKYQAVVPADYGGSDCADFEFIDQIPF